MVCDAESVAGGLVRVKTKPDTKYALVRSRRTEQPTRWVKVVTADEFDFTEYQFLKLHESGKYEEWVHKDDHRLWLRVMENKVI